MAASKARLWTKTLGLGLFCVSLILALGSYSAEDPSLNTFSKPWKSPHNVLGYFGSWGSDILLQAFGLGAWLIPALLFVQLTRWMLQRDRNADPMSARSWGALAVVVAAVTLFGDIWFSAKAAAGYPIQGLLGVALGTITKPLVGSWGANILVLTLLWAFCMIWWEALPFLFIEKAADFYRFMNVKLDGKMKLPKIPFPKVDPTKLFAIKDNKQNSEASTQLPVSQSAQASSQSAQTTDFVAAPVAAPTKGDKKGPIINLPTEEQRTNRKTAPKEWPSSWQLPPLSLLEAAKKKIKGPNTAHLEETAKKIRKALHSFGVEGEVTEVSPGPIITMYEYQPAEGIRVNKLVSLQTDLAMALGAPSVRVVAPIPGKTVVGIEVPNVDREEIVLRDVFEATVDRARHMKLPIVMGRDGEGKPVVEDLSRMPHLLIGGATSMGKSVLVNSILSGLLCRFAPDQLRLIIVDPKLVEFKSLEDIPHLLLPIVNDPTDASQALKWAVSETKKRYLLMQKFAAKNLESYNAKVAEVDPKDFREGEAPTRFPYIVIVIDELAELMLTAKKDVETSIVRLTQLARAAGIHLIMATQRPSADVVTGMIKSNCPSRAALRVASSSDSRIILDTSAAEHLLGKGDMFFTSAGPMGLKRVQSCFISDAEIERIGNHWRAQGEPEYKDEILAPDLDDQMGLEENANDRDPLFSDVLDFAREKGQISTSLIQRRFQIGYTRAARIMEQFESAGVVGEQAAAGKPRDVIA